MPDESQDESPPSVVSHTPGLALSQTTSLVIPPRLQAPVDTNHTLHQCKISPPAFSLREFCFFSLRLPSALQHLTTYNAWRTQATADKAAKCAQNLAEWELKCLALPPGTRKPKKPTQPRHQDTPARFRAVSKQKKPAQQHIVGDSDEWESGDEANDFE